MSKAHGSPKHSTQSTDLITGPGADAAAHLATTAARQALALGDLIRVSTDVGSAAAIAIGAAPRILSFRAAIERLPDSPPGVVDDFIAYAQAASYANIIYSNVMAGTDEVQKLHVEVAPIRAKYLGVLDLGVVFSIVDPAVVARIRAGTGYRDEAEDVIASASVIQDHWSQFDGKSPITLADLAHGRERAGALNRAVALRDADALPSVTAATADRARAFTLLVRSYDQIRRALSYIRWTERDVDEIAPSLWNAPGNGHHTAASNANTGTATPTSPSTGTTSTSQPAAAPAIAAPAAGTVPVGDPGPSGTPFTR